MPISKCFTFAGLALLIVLFACQAHFYDLYFHEGVGSAGGEFRLTAEITPAARIKDTFAMFVPGDARRMRDTARFFARAVKPQT